MRYLLERTREFSKKLRKNQDIPGGNISPIFFVFQEEPGHNGRKSYFANSKSSQQWDYKILAKKKRCSAKQSIAKDVKKIR